MIVTRLRINKGSLSTYLPLKPSSKRRQTERENTLSSMDKQVRG